jgi:hypothetical protein
MCINGKHIKALQLGQELDYIKLKQKKLSYNNYTNPFRSNVLPNSHRSTLPQISYYQ